MNTKTIQLVFLSLIFILAACTSSNPQDKIVCTTNIVSDLVNQIKPPTVSIMGAGTDPHLYKSKSGDHQLFNKAEVIVYSGLHLEGKITDALENLSHKKTVINLSDGIPKNNLITSEDFGGSFDPHFWFNIDLYKNTVVHTSSFLQNKFPTDADSIALRTKRYLKELETTAKELDKMIESIPVENRILVTAHDAFNYFGIKYNFIVKGVQGASTVSEAGLKDITELVDYIVEKKVPAIFIESSVSERNIKAIIEGCKAKNHPVKLGGLLYSDALGEINSPTGNYLGMMRYNVQTICSALNKPNEP